MSGAYLITVEQIDNRMHSIATLTVAPVREICCAVYSEPAVRVLPFSHAGQPEHQRWTAASAEKSSSNLATNGERKTVGVVFFARDQNGCDQQGARLVGQNGDRPSVYSASSARLVPVCGDRGVLYAVAWRARLRQGGHEPTHSHNGVQTVKPTTGAAATKTVAPRLEYLPSAAESACYRCKVCNTFSG